MILAIKHDTVNQMKLRYVLVYAKEQYIMLVKESLKTNQLNITTTLNNTETFSRAVSHNINFFFQMKQELWKN